MSCFLFGVFMFAAGGALFYWVAGHPDDTRALMQRARDAAGRLIHREP